MQTFDHMIATDTQIPPIAGNGTLGSTIQSSSTGQEGGSRLRKFR